MRSEEVGFGVINFDEGLGSDLDLELRPRPSWVLVWVDVVGGMVPDVDVLVEVVELVVLDVGRLRCVELRSAKLRGMVP